MVEQYPRPPHTSRPICCLSQLSPFFPSNAFMASARSFNKFVLAGNWIGKPAYRSFLLEFAFEPRKTVWEVSTGRGPILLDYTARDHVEHGGDMMMASKSPCFILFAISSHFSSSYTSWPSPKMRSTSTISNSTPLAVQSCGYSCAHRFCEGPLRRGTVPWRLYLLLVASACIRRGCCLSRCRLICMISQARGGMGRRPW